MALTEAVTDIQMMPLEAARVRLADLWFNPTANDEVVTEPLLDYLNSIQTEATFYDRPPYTHVVDRIQRECEEFAKLSKRGCATPDYQQVAGSFHANLVDSHTVIDMEEYSWKALLPRTVTLTVLDQIENMIGVRREDVQ